MVIQYWFQTDDIYVAIGPSLHMLFLKPFGVGNRRAITHIIDHGKVAAHGKQFYVVNNVRCSLSLEGYN